MQAYASVYVKDWRKSIARGRTAPNTSSQHILQFALRISSLSSGCWSS